MLWHLIEVSYDRGRTWAAIALFKFEVEAVAYCERHNSHRQAGRLRHSLASSAATSERPDLPAPPGVLVGKSALTPNVQGNNHSRAVESRAVMFLSAAHGAIYRVCWLAHEFKREVPMTTPIDVEQAIAAIVADTEDRLVGNEPSIANTYTAIAAEMREQEAAQRRLKPGLEAETVLINGAVPRMTTGAWAAGDQFGTEPPLGFDINGPDPSGSQRFKGTG